MPEVSLVLVPGSYNPVSEYQHIIDAVRKAGYEVVGVDLPTVGPGIRQGKDTPAPSMYDDASAIAAVVEKLADKGQYVVIVGHSYAGVPMSQSTNGLDKASRAQQGKPGGIVTLAYLAALVPPLGGSAGSLLDRFPDKDRPAVSIDVSSRFRRRNGGQ
jgi:pimeloyl-ACP methyl ester carboxylesterase